MAARLVGRPLQERLMHEIRVGAGGCWNWFGNQSTDGYGRMFHERIRRYTHRIAYELFIGPVPEKLQLDHLCRNRLCANPCHMEPVTQAENIRRGFSNSAINARKTHCKRGHEFTPENTHLHKGPYGLQRWCRACRLYRKAPSGEPKPRALRTHCKRGHEMTPDNVKLRNAKSKTTRLCRACLRARSRLKDQRRRQKKKCFAAKTATK